MNENLTHIRNIVVFIEDDAQYLSLIAKQLKLSTVREIPADAEFCLSLHTHILSLTTLCSEEKTEINVDFASAASTYRREQGSGKNQALGKAIGLNKKNDLHVLDATAGLGKDSFVLASLGCVVTMLERSPIVGALLNDGLKRGLDDPDIQHLVKNMSLIIADSVDYMRSDSLLRHPPDVVYLDPMYPARKKSAKVKKEMQVLQQLLGHKVVAYEESLEVLLDAALGCAKKRVVVKRPKGALSLSARIPTHTVESKKTRYDVYMCF